jgi:protocatechuate 3,4-dioxygenase beta subunit
MMKKYLLAVFVLLAALTISAKDKDNKAKDAETGATLMVSGLVVDENSGESLVGVEVSLEGTDRKTYTDFDGQFSFNNVKPGEYKLTTNYISYRKESQEMKVNGKENNIKITLQSSN